MHHVAAMRLFSYCTLISGRLGRIEVAMNFEQLNLFTCEGSTSYF